MRYKNDKLFVNKVLKALKEEDSGLIFATSYFGVWTSDYYKNFQEYEANIKKPQHSV